MRMMRLTHEGCHSIPPCMSRRESRRGRARQLGEARSVRQTVSVVSRAEAQSVAAAQGLVFPCGADGAWDAGAVGNPVVRVFPGDSGSRWFMWYTGRETKASDIDAVLPSAGKIGVAISDDGIKWQRSTGPVEGDRTASDVGACLESDEGDWWTLDTCAMAVADVQMFASADVGGGSGLYWMFYTGCDYLPVQVPEGLPGMTAGQAVEGLCARPGLAMSQDGRNWARIEADHHTHALFDRGEEGEWDSLFAAGPQVLAAGPKDMRLYYHSYDVSAKRYKIGLATSADGFTWDKQGPAFAGGEAGEFDSRGSGAHCVVRDLDSREYYMFYEAFDDDGKRSIGFARSGDGLKDWARHPEPILQACSDADAWDSGEVGAPYAVSMAAGKWRLYYAGKSTGESAWSGIGVALSLEQSEALAAPTQFRRRVK